MKITGFSPLIVTKDAEAVVKVFEDLGFEKRHTKTGIEGGQNTNYNMKDSNGNRINIASSNNVPQDLTAITINVDNFQEAYDFFIAHGFVNPRGDKVTDTPSSRATMLFSPSGFAVTISEHIKD
ncbi:hypothetical protein SAMN02910456_00121 [Ruminococcaceae bacterium YRB3002]|nr:hypothetical protein SAMN02910456_00121 [Ruminococcaceae bacterium YRB3002]